MKKILTLTLLSLLLVAGCNSYADSSDPEKMYDIASDLKDLAAGVDALVKFDNGKNLTKSELLLKAVNHDSSRLEIFTGYDLQLKIEGENSSVLLCEGNRAIIEDSGCSAKSDIHHWKNDSVMACEFTLDLTKVCK
ncbi:hypothetical protein [Idiomarina sp. HP20-50]|uniref:hypothetical protein n=1 Tax=Idiomarina sp. HP20-50 TaxID=3070813 RepID=UPI00294B13EB|nr:hypothetical protein [Idiomarina sp. HP20-50]MDV6317212.1 hypothetical protein [Idiomarina sp. HP20-50]